MSWTAESGRPSPAVLGDPASVAAIGAALQRAAYEIDVAMAAFTRTATAPDPGGGGTEQGLTRRQRARVRELQRDASTVTASLERAGIRLAEHASELAEAIGLAQRITDRAESHGLRVDGVRVERVGGVHGVADRAAEKDRAETLSRLQRVLDTVLIDLDTRRRSLRTALAAERARVRDPLA